MTKIYKVKIRIYNQEFPGKPTPTGQFQGFFDADAPLTEFGEPNLDYWLTQKEIGWAKRDMHLEFNQPTIWNPDESKITYYIENSQIVTGKEGIPSATTLIAKEPKYGIKLIPRALLGKITIEDLVVGISTVAPVEEMEPQGAFKERLMVIKENEVNWDSGPLNIQVFAISEPDLDRWRSET